MSYLLLTDGSSKLLQTDGSSGLLLTDSPVIASMSGAWGGWTGTMSAAITSGSTTITATMDGAWGGWSGSAFAYPTGPLTISGGTTYSLASAYGGDLTLASTPAPSVSGFVTVASAGTIVTTLSGPIAADFEPMWNDAGSGSISYELDDDPINYGDVVRCYYRGRAAFSWIATERNANTVPAGGAETPTVTWAGPGWITELSSARVRPSRGFGASPVEETRSFGWPSVTYDDGSWGTLSVSLGEMGNPTPYWYGLANYPDATTEWMWAPGASTSWARTGDVYFRHEFEVATAGNYEIAFAADDRGELYLDGQRLLTTGNWDNSTASIHTQTVFLSAGDHLIALWAQNNSGEFGNNPAGVLVTVTGEGGTGAVLRSGAGWKCLPYPLVPPGVTVASAFIRILEEAQDDGVLPNLDLSFDDYTDSDGVPWGFLVDVTAPVGSDLWAFLKAHVGVDIDVRMRPGTEVIDAWVPGTGGATRAITLRTPTDEDDPYSGNLMSLEHQSQAARANAAVVRWADGWKYVTTGATPVVEIQLNLGHITTEDEAERVALAELADLSTVREQITATVDVRDDEWPWHDYWEGDIVTVPDSSGTPTEQRVVALAAMIEDDEITITPTLKDRIAEDIERHENWLKAMAEGASRGNTGTVSPPKLGPPFNPPAPIKQQTWSLPVWTAKSGGVYPAPTLWLARRFSFNLDAAATGTRTVTLKVNGASVSTLTLSTGQSATFESLTTVIEAGDEVSITTTGTETFGGNATLEYQTR